MAININRTEENLNIQLSNGHLEALGKITRDYGLKSEKEAITFMLGVLSQANGSPIEIRDNKYLPSDDLRNNTN